MTLTHSSENLSFQMPFVFLGTADDKSQQYPYAPTRRHAADLKTLLVMNAVLSPPIVIEEGFLLAAGESLTLGASGSVLIDAISAGLIKVMSRSSDLEGYATARRQKKHASPPDTIEGRNFLSELQRTCSERNAFIPYPPPSIDQITFRRLADLSRKSAIHELFRLNHRELNAFPELFEVKFETGLDGRKWTARSAWEAAAVELFGSNSQAIHALMTIANRQRQLIRGAALATMLNEFVIVETGFELGGEDLVETNAMTLQGITVRRAGRRRLASDVPIITLATQYKELFAALANPESDISKTKALWINASEHVSHTEDIQSALDHFFEITDEYAHTLRNFGATDNINRSGENSNSLNAVELGYSVAVPASLQVMAGSELNRRELMRNASALGMVFGADYILRPWSLNADSYARSRLIFTKQPIENLDKVGALTAVQTNFHERLVVGPGKIAA